MRWIVRGDIDGFFGLALDNLVQLLLIDTLCRTVLGFPPELLYGQVLPAAAVSILVGNVAYALQARALAARTGRTDVCALPYGINTVSLFAHVFLVMLPAKARRVAIMCAEMLWWQCHRGLIADYLKAHDHRVTHIAAAGRTEPHPFTSAARIIDGRLSYLGLLDADPP